MIKSFPRPSSGGGIAILYKESLHSFTTCTNTFSFTHLSFEAAELALTLGGKKTSDPPPFGTTNRLTAIMFHDDFFLLLDHYKYNPKTDNIIILGDFNIHFESADNPNTKTYPPYANYNLEQFVKPQPTVQPTY